MRLPCRSRRRKRVTRLPGHVYYVIPPNHYLSIQKGALHLNETVSRPAIPMPIDHFMRTLAEDQQGRSVGIVLTGADHDGTLGLKEIKAAGGLTIVQEPGSAQHSGMPKSAMSAQPDWILPIAQMPQAPVDHVAYSESDMATAIPATAGDALQDILTLIRSRTGHDSRWYRHWTNGETDVGSALRAIDSGSCRQGGGLRSPPGKAGRTAGTGDADHRSRRQDATHRGTLRPGTR